MKRADKPTRVRVLVIDDQEPTRYVFRHNLTRAGFEIEEAGTGAEGLAKAMEGPDIIICDVNLPDMLGYDVCRRLKSNPVTVSIPVLQISASFISDESKVQALEGGADSYLTQPVESTVLVAQINALLRLRRAESTANLSARQWQTTFDSLTDGIVLLNAERMIVRTNRTFLNMFDLVSSQIEGLSANDLFLGKFKIAFDEFLGRRKIHQAVELEFDTRWFRLSYDRIETDPQHDGGSILLVTNVTDHRKLQETVRLSERLAATGRLAHVIAHEINNPLEAMTNLLYLAAKASEGVVETHGYIEQASTELERISQITKQVLAYHRESKDPVATPAGEIVEGTLAMFRTHFIRNQVVLDAQLRCSNSVYVQPGEIRQVFSNLISNALDAIGPDGGKLRIRCFSSVDFRTGIEGVRFLFSDSGSGIPSNILPRIFDAFYTTKNLKGSGIGLWLSAEVLAKHHGYFRVRTRTEGPYRGTLFSIFLPDYQS